MWACPVESKRSPYAAASKTCQSALGNTSRCMPALCDLQPLMNMGFLLGTISGTMLNYKRDLYVHPLHGPLVRLILILAHVNLEAWPSSRFRLDKHAWRMYVSQTLLDLDRNPKPIFTKSPTWIRPYRAAA